jgi:pimeloyl-ACP methyl ester carboxylesterase
MFNQVVKKLSIMLAIVLCLQLGFSGTADSAAESPVGVKELNFVFLHGALGNSCGPQFLADSVLEQIPRYILDYERANPGIKVKVNVMHRCYPNDVDVETWANNIADSIDKYLPGKGNLILIGHSMGGKSALYAVAKNVGNLADRTALVVTINSPIKSLDRYSVAGGGSFVAYCRAALWNTTRGACMSVGTYDSSEDGKWVSQNKHWLAFISGENAPLSPQFDYGGLDPYPRDMDDGALPMSAQYSDGADVIYYGECGHSEFHTVKKVADFLAGEIIQYIFGGTIECSVLARDGGFGHKAPSFLGTDYWQDIIGDVFGISGKLLHWNQSYIKWQEWEDIAEYYPPTYEKDQRSRYEASQVRSSAIFAGIEEVRWLNPDNPEDCHLYLRTRVAPRSYIQVDWRIYRQGLLPEGTKRDHYEIEIVAGTPLAEVYRASWATDNLRDLRVQVWSRAERPFRWFEAKWRVYYQEGRYRQVIDKIPALTEVAPIE